MRDYSEGTEEHQLMNVQKACLFWVTTARLLKFGAFFPDFLTLADILLVNINYILDNLGSYLTLHHHIRICHKIAILCSF